MGFHILTKRHLRRHTEDTNHSLVTTSSAHFDWIVRDDMRDAVLGSQAPDWFALRSCDTARLVESGHLRTVWQVRSRGVEFFAKVSCVSGFRGHLKMTVLGTPAEREWRVAVAATAREIPLPEFVALGVRKGSTAETVLLTIAIPNAITLTTAWQASATNEINTSGRRRRAVLIQEVASLLCQAHQAGFSHRDGHPNNVLLSQPEEGSVMRAFFVDTLGARLTRGPADSERTALSFAQLDQHFHRVASRTDRLRLLRAYYQCMTEARNGAGARQWRRRMVPLIGQHRQRIAASLARLRDRRFSRDNKYFARLHLADGWRATVVLRLERRHVFPEAHIPDRTTAEWRTILDTALHTLRRDDDGIPSPACGDIEFEYSDIARFTDGLGATFRPTRHRRLFEVCHEMRHRDVNCELILGYAEHRSNGLINASVLIRPRAPELATDAPGPEPRNCGNSGNQTGDG